MGVEVIVEEEEVGDRIKWEAKSSSTLKHRSSIWKRKTDILSYQWITVSTRTYLNYFKTLHRASSTHTPIKLSSDSWKRAYMRKPITTLSSKKNPRITSSRVTPPATIWNKFASCYLYGSNWTSFPFYSNHFLLACCITTKPRKSLKWWVNSLHNSGISSRNCKEPKNRGILHECCRKSSLTSSSLLEQGVSWPVLACERQIQVLITNCRQIDNNYSSNSIDYTRC